MHPSVISVSEEVNGCCGEGPVHGAVQRFAVEAIVSIDGRGQMVLPKAVRDRMGLNAGDKLAISVMESGGRPCCLTLIRTEELADRVRDILGPAVNEKM